jgi:sugar fermentation stimulation protein A
MRFEQPLIEGVLLRRYKRFLADVRLCDGRTVTAHTPNTGSMLGCAEPGLRVWLRDAGNPRRKYPYSWELVELRCGVLVGINTTLANRLVREAIEDGSVRALQGYGRIRPEQRYGLEGSRIDLLLEDGPRGRCYVEVKNVTLVEDRIALFPDAVSLRGTRHLRELARMVAEGARAVVLFCVQRADARAMRPAAHIDPEYAQTLCAVMEAGVEALAYGARVSTQGIALHARLGLSCP